jgi:hypothetical protein
VRETVVQTFVRQLCDDFIHEKLSSETNEPAAAIRVFLCGPQMRRDDKDDSTRLERIGWGRGVGARMQIVGHTLLIVRWRHATKMAFFAAPVQKMSPFVADCNQAQFIIMTAILATDYDASG